MNIKLELMTEADYPALFHFEKTNKDFFEKYVPPRNPAYFHFNSFTTIMEQLLQEQEQGISSFYLIKNDKEEIVGRLNIVDINMETKVGNLGYRVGQSFTDKGSASEALRLFLNKEIYHLQLRKLEAKTTSNNIGSQKVLARNGFTLIRKEVGSVVHHGEQLDFFHYLYEVK